ncbi:MAG: Rpn family recombination-promoting nuclease/putative transposase [Lachnospiraceae bacterium]|nr:Rpn family recombination-promoting nuclease/putative transposase [Lachnospiraceae bacterium]
MNGSKLPSLSSDIIAKKIFDSCEHKERLEYLLRGIIGDQKIQIESGALQEGYIHSTSSKKKIMDIPSNLVDGRFVDTEVQQLAQEFILQRGDIYSSNMLMIQYSSATDQSKGEIDYQNVKGTILVCLMKNSSKTFLEYESDRYIHRFTTRTADSGLKYETLGTIIYVQLDKCLEQFRKGINGETDDFLQLLLSMMANINDDKVISKAMENEIAKDIVSEVKELVQDKEVQKMLLAEKYAVADYNSAIRYAKTEERDALGAEAEELKKKGKSAEEILSILFPKTANITVS